MGGVRPNRKAIGYFRKTYLSVSEICALNPAGPIATFARAAKRRPLRDYRNIPRQFVDAFVETIS